MRKWILGIILLTACAEVRADIAVTEGSGKTVSTTTDQSKEFQNVVVSTSYINNAAGVPKALGYNSTGSSMPVNIVGGSIANTSFAISTGGVTAAQSGTWTVNVATGGVTATQGGSPWTVNVATGGVTVAGTVTANISGSINNTSFAISTGGVTAAQGVPGTVDWPVRLGTTTVIQGNPGTVDWAVRVASTNVSQSTVTIMAPNNNTTPIPISGSISASLVNITTATPNTTLPTAAQFIGGIGSSGLLQSFRTDISSNQLVNVVNSSFTVSVATGGVTATQGGTWTVNVATGGVTAAQGGTWTVQPGNTPNTQDWRVTMGTNAINVIYQPTVFGTTTTYNGTQTVNVATGGVTVAQIGTWTVNVATGGVTAAQGIAGTLDWPVRLSTTNISVVTATVTIQAPNNNTTAIPVSGSLSANTVNITTASWDTTIPNQGTIIGGLGPTGLMQSFRVDSSSNQLIAGTLSDNGAAATSNALATLGGIYETNYNAGTAGTAGRNATFGVGTDGLLWTAQLPAIRPASFSASTNTFNSATSATHLACIRGNDSNTVLVYGARVSCTQTTAGNVILQIVKSTQSFTGNWSTMTTVAHDTNANVGVSTAVFFNNSAPTTNMGTIQVLDAYNLGCMATTTATPNDVYLSPSSWRQKPIVLRGLTQSVCANLGATTVTGGKFNAAFDWIETATISP